MRDGRKYMELVDLDLKFETDKLRVNFGNLFNNDKALGNNRQSTFETQISDEPVSKVDLFSVAGNQMNAFLNENWKEILHELRPSVQEALGAAFKEIARRLFSKVPYDDIFLK